MPRDGPPQLSARLMLPILPQKPLPVQCRHTAASAQWSRREESPRLDLTPRERALERAMRKEARIRVPPSDHNPGVHNRMVVRDRPNEDPIPLKCTRGCCRKSSVSGPCTESYRPCRFCAQPVEGSPYFDTHEHQSAEILSMGDELSEYHDTLKMKLNTRFKSLGRAFRMIDQNKSNTCDVQELQQGLTRMFNLEHIPQVHMERMAELMDSSGDGVVRLDEFSRFFTDDHRPQSAVNVRRENALRKARRPASSPTRERSHAGSHAR